MKRNNHKKLNSKDLEKLFVIRSVLNGTLTQTEASQILSLTTRQIRRIMKRVKTEGNEGIIHKSRGRASNHRYPEKLKDRVIKLYHEKYNHLSPTLAACKLLEVDNIELHGETLRKWLIETGDRAKNVKKRSDIDIVITDRVDSTWDKGESKKFLIDDKKAGNSSIPRKKAIKKKEQHDDENHFTAPKKKYIPPPDHPWRKLMYPQYLAKFKEEN